MNSKNFIFTLNKRDLDVQHVYTKFVKLKNQENSWLFSFTHLKEVWNWHVKKLNYSFNVLLNLVYYFITFCQ